MSIPTAPLLAPYTASPLPTQSLTLITSVLGATSNWLVLRILCDALSSAGGRGGEELEFNAGRGGVRGVVFVSFLRGLEFWRAEARRLGLDLARLSKQGNFAFVDGVSELFLASQTGPGPAPGPSVASRSANPARIPSHATLSDRRAVSGRSPTATSPQKSSGSASRKLRWSGMGNAGLDSLELEIASAIDDLRGDSASDERPVENDVLLIMDQPDLLLAAIGPGMGVGAVEMREFLLGLRQRVHSTVVTLAADSPLIHAGPTESTEQQPTPLEKEHASLVVGMAHQARMVMQLRGLDTGVARDVSGVLRISRGGGWVPETEKGDGHGHAGLEEKEVLYFVQGDSAVRVFGRGE
ncbi:elongator complex protein 6 [Blastomyces parvus]|uniref:Elongator complex protein 6 n=1 Tax=Blastomyces parvus TaxID=2060905 RepID=A0A2B7X7Y7_9EURO|nr:elongator complex protein 6 [Blastomyces parvus]